MNNFFDPQDVLTAVKNLLVADTVLPGVNYLGYANRIFTMKAPEKQPMPYLLVTLDMLVPDEMQTYSGECRVYSYVELLSNGQIDGSKGNRITSRCEELLNDLVPVISGATVQPLVSLGVVPHFYDAADDKSRSRGVARFRVQCGKG